MERIDHHPIFVPSHQRARARTMLYPRRAEMTTRTRTMARGSDVFTRVETSPHPLSSWLAGLMLLIVITLVASLLHSAVMMSRSSFNGPMIMPEGSTMPGTGRVRDGNERALGSIAGMPATGTTASGSSKIPVVRTP